MGFRHDDTSLSVSWPSIPPPPHRPALPLPGEPPLPPLRDWLPPAQLLRAQRGGRWAALDASLQRVLFSSGQTPRHPPTTDAAGGSGGRGAASLLPPPPPPEEVQVVVLGNQGVVLPLLALAVCCAVDEGAGGDSGGGAATVTALLDSEAERRWVAAAAVRLVGAERAGRVLRVLRPAAFMKRTRHALQELQRLREDAGEGQVGGGAGAAAGPGAAPRVLSVLLGDAGSFREAEGQVPWLALLRLWNELHTVRCGRCGRGADVVRIACGPAWPGRIQCVQRCVRAAACSEGPPGWRRGTTWRSRRRAPRCAARASARRTSGARGGASTG